MMYQEYDPISQNNESIIKRPRKFEYKRNENDYVNLNHLTFER